MVGETSSPQGVSSDPSPDSRRRVPQGCLLKDGHGARSVESESRPAPGAHSARVTNPTQIILFQIRAAVGHHPTECENLCLSVCLSSCHEPKNILIHLVYLANIKLSLSIIYLYLCIHLSLIYLSYLLT